MKSKYKFNLEELKNFRVGEDNLLYKISYPKKSKSYGVKVMKMQPPKRYRIEGRWWSKIQLDPHMVVDKSPIVLFHVTPEN